MLIRREPSALGLREALGSLYGFEADDSLVVINGDDDCVSGPAGSLRGVISMLNAMPFLVFPGEPTWTSVENEAGPSRSKFLLAKSCVKEAPSR